PSLPRAKFITESLPAPDGPTTATTTPLPINFSDNLLHTQCNSRDPHSLAPDGANQGNAIFCRHANDVRATAHLDGSPVVQADSLRRVSRYPRNRLWQADALHCL